MILTVQEVFNKGYIGLKKQGRFSVNDEGVCLYRSENGDKCFIGFSIPDDIHSKSIENSSASVALHQSGVRVIGGVSILKAMQKSCHDCFCAFDFKTKEITNSHFAKMELWAKGNGLTVPDSGEVK